MILMDNVARFLVTLALAAGLIWAVAVWRSRQRTAALVATACALQLAVRLIWLPVVRLLFGELTRYAGPVPRFFIWTGTMLSQLALAVSLALLVYAALGPANRKP